MIAYGWNIPSWFKEGLAVFVSSGGGAESVSRSEAVAAVVAGQTFIPAASGRLLFERSGHSYGLSPHMWYQQSALLVEFLKTKDAAAFRELLLDLRDGERFEDAIVSCYKTNLEVLVHEFRSGSFLSQDAQESPQSTEVPSPQPRLK